MLVQGGLGDSVEPALERSGYPVIWKRTAGEALELLARESPAMVIVDLAHLRVSPDSFCQKVKKLRNAPIIVLGPEPDSLPSGQMQMLLTEMQGCADSYLARPFTPRRLLAQVEKLMPEGYAMELRAGDLVFHPADGTLRKRGEEHYLNPKLTKLLQIFMQHPGDVMERKELMQKVWETTYMGDTRTLDVHIRWLREMIEDDATDPHYLRTVRGQGYRFDNPKSRK